MIRIYVAASSGEKSRAAKAMEWIRAEPGLELAHDWVAVQASVQAAGGPSDAELPRADARRYAMEDLRKVEGARIFWLLVPETAGAWVEFGYALGRIAAIEQRTNSPAYLHQKMTA
ncbi:MAG: hypothetical protein O7G84_19360, partial [Gammaproteobacteria bacterium]|nr:hypothetical protein [Gammaproteobacteria bacterium]